MLRPLFLDEYGAAKVRRYYKGVPAKTAFGVDLARLEKDWHARLAAVTLRPGARSVLAERSTVTAAQRNPAEAKLTAEILGPDSDWHPVPRGALADGEPGSWEAEGTLALSGAATQGDWCVARVGAELGDALVRCTLEPGDAFGVQIQLGIGCQAMILRGQTVEIVLRRRAGVASVWVDGVLVGEAKVDGAPARLGVGCVGGKARARDIRLRL
jgi:hypothetical protein